MPRRVNDESTERTTVDRNNPCRVFSKNSLKCLTDHQLNGRSREEAVSLCEKVFDEYKLCKEVLGKYRQKFRTRPDLPVPTTIEEIKAFKDNIVVFRPRERKTPSSK